MGISDQGFNYPPLKALIYAIMYIPPQVISIFPMLQNAEEKFNQFKKTQINFNTGFEFLSDLSVEEQSNAKSLIAEARKTVINLSELYFELRRNADSLAQKCAIADKKVIELKRDLIFQLLKEISKHPQYKDAQNASLTSAVKVDCGFMKDAITNSEFKIANDHKSFVIQCLKYSGISFFPVPLTRGTASRATVEEIKPNEALGLSQANAFNPFNDEHDANIASYISARIAYFKAFELFSLEFKSPTELQIKNFTNAFLILNKWFPAAFLGAMNQFESTAREGDIISYAYMIACLQSMESKDPSLSEKEKTDFIFKELEANTEIDVKNKQALREAYSQGRLKALIGFKFNASLLLNIEEYRKILEEKQYVNADVALNALKDLNFVQWAAPDMGLFNVEMRDYCFKFMRGISKLDFKQQKDFLALVEQRTLILGSNALFDPAVDESKRKSPHDQLDYRAATFILTLYPEELSNKDINALVVLREYNPYIEQKLIAEARLFAMKPASVDTVYHIFRRLAEFHKAKGNEDYARALLDTAFELTNPDAFKKESDLNVKQSEAGVATATELDQKPKKQRFAGLRRLADKLKDKDKGKDQEVKKEPSSSSAKITSSLPSSTEDYTVVQPKAVVAEANNSDPKPKTKMFAGLRERLAKRSKDKDKETKNEGSDKSFLNRFKKAPKEEIKPRESEFEMPTTNSNSKKKKNPEPPVVEVEMRSRRYSHSNSQ
jgi:hypothetical protein